MASRAVAILLGLLTLAFAGRVVGQAMQRWSPQAWLPAFDAFQGSRLPYGLLLTVQIALLALMVRLVIRTWYRRPPPRDGVVAVALILSALYLIGSLTRIAIGLAWAGAPAWFTTWIPAAFHVVLALFACAWSAHAASTRSRHGAGVTIGSNPG